jgi:EmrB/QacA subfamily drug resistance transporter
VTGAGHLLPDRRIISAAMLGIASGAILVPLNTTMLAVALPDVMGEFRLGASQVASLVTLYLGAVAVTLPLGGAIGDRYGHRRAFIVGVLGFAAASALAALAASFELLQAARVAQAATGALISTSAASLISQTTPPDRQGEAFGTFDLLVSTSAAVGPFVGGLLVGGFGWRSLFVLALPLGLVSAGFLGLALRPPAPQAADAGVSRRQRASMDLPGLALLALAIVAFLVALRNLGDPLGVAAAVAIVPLLAAFVVIELRADRPAVDPRLVLHRPFAAAALGVFGSTVILHGSFILVPLAVEELFGETATTSGIVLLGLAAVGAVVAPFGGMASDRRGRRVVVVAGCLVSAAGLAALATPAGASSALTMALLLCVVGLGNGLTSPRQAAALESVEGARIGMASGTYYMSRYLGGVVGASLAGAILGARVTAGGVAAGFAVLAAVGVAVALVSLGLPGQPAPPEPGEPAETAGSAESSAVRRSGGLLPFR